MIRIQVSKFKFIELVNRELRTAAQHVPCAQVRAVPVHINPRGYVLTNGTPLANELLAAAIAEVGKKYWYEINRQEVKHAHTPPG